MPIKISGAAPELHVDQTYKSPTVYFDHWAMRLFSDDRAAQDRFVSALHAKGGTLLLSPYTFFEYVNVGDQRHIVDTGRLIDKLAPNIYRSTFVPDFGFKLRRSADEHPSPPPPDLEQLKLAAAKTQGAPLGTTMLQLVSNANPYRANLSAALDEVVSKHVAAIESVRKDPAYVAKARMFQPSDLQPGIKLVYAELTRGWILDGAARISKNDIVDLMHAATSIAYCDFALLDAAWVERAGKMKQRFEKSATPVSFAKCYSRRNGGVEEFLRDIEAFVSQPLS
jgi:hypothetical protein